jgi:hypothetical protein
MADIKVAVINQSKSLSDDDVKQAVPALQAQVHHDFAPVWGIDAELKFVPSNSEPPAGSWWLVIFDNSDQPGALGYHDLTSEGLPLGKVFAGTDMQYGLNWTITASHELLEMLADPDIDLTVFVQPDDQTGRIYAYEICDACEADNYGYAINGTMVSDFVYPAWFESFRASNSTQFDKQDQIHKPFDLLAGGYIGIYDVTSGTGWTQLTAAHGRHAKGTRPERPRVGSRRERRRTPRHHWRRSESHHRRAR